MHDDVDEYASSPTTGPLHTDEYSQPLELGTPGLDRQTSSPSAPVDVNSVQINSPIVPAGTVTGTSLTLVVTIMCFLACLTAGAVYMINQSASAWLRNVSSEVTIQIEPRENVDTERVVRDVTVFLASQPGVRGVRPLSLETVAEMIEPWLGKSEALKELPVPRLIALELDRAAPGSRSVESGPGGAVQGRDPRRPPPLAAADPLRHPVVGARRHRDPDTCRRRDDRDHRLRDA